LTGWNMTLIHQRRPLLAKHFFNTPRAYAMGNPARRQDQTPAGYASTPSLIYQSYAAFAADVRRHRIDRSITTVVYDPERWALTPINEQRHPLRYVRMFARIGHAEGYLVMAAPGRDLMGTKGGACTQQEGQTYDEAYLACRIPAMSAKFTDGFEIQSQSNEFRPRRFAHLVRLAAAQARRANPSVVVLAGLSTAPPSGVATAAIMTRAAIATIRYVAGFWVNVFPSHPGQLRTAIRFFGSMRRSGY
jgi:hypothetical protein